MAISKYATGLAHIGIPTNDMAATEEFYTSLGFTVALETENPDTGVKIKFFQVGDLLLEFYENHMATGTYGAINHIAVNVTDASAALEEMKAAGCYTLINTELQFRPYWDNGCQFFNVEGPNKEILEFNQLL
ncbi:VOC family protein [Anaerolentibacter hominis]|uniref:VOC family protein n=1 Tax=Anaerolentibacter hominis TaxID=3079009 RepID=UPI0031B8A152